MKKSTYWFKGICFMLFLCGALLIGLNGHAQSIYKRGAVPVMEPIEFVSGKTAEARLEIFNVTGQKIATLLERRVEKGVLNRIEYKPVMTPGVLIYRLSLDNEFSQGTLLYNK